MRWKAKQRYDDIIKNDPTVHEMILHCYIGEYTPDELRCVFEALKDNTHINTLATSFCSKMDDDLIKDIVNAIKRNKSIDKIYVSYNKNGDSRHKDLLELLFEPEYIFEQRVVGRWGPYDKFVGQYKHMEITRKNNLVSLESMCGRTIRCFKTKYDAKKNLPECFVDLIYEKKI